MALVLENSVEMARASAVGDWVTLLGDEQLGERAKLVGDIAAHKSRMVTSVLSQTFERPDGFPTVVEAFSPAARAQRRTKKLVVGAIVAVAAAALSVAAARRGNWRAPPASAIREPPKANSQLPEVDPPEPPEPARGESAVPAPQSAVPDKRSASAAASSTAKVSRGTSPKPKSKASACDPPFTIDGEGFKHYKLECNLDK
jgi:serine/threonine-protein kinase